MLGRGLARRVWVGRPTGARAGAQRAGSAGGAPPITRLPRTRGAAAGWASVVRWVRTTAGWRGWKMDSNLPSGWGRWWYGTLKRVKPAGRRHHHGREVQETSRAVARVEHRGRNATAGSSNRRGEMRRQNAHINGALRGSRCSTTSAIPTAQSPHDVAAGADLRPVSVGPPSS